MNDPESGKVAVIGLGYVGLPLSLLFLEKGFAVTGIDVDEGKIQSLKRGESYLSDLPGERLVEASRTGLFEVSSNSGRVADAEAVVICVPSPLNERYEPDLTYIRAAALSIEPHLQRNQLIVLETTSFPGTTEEVLVPILTSRGFRIGEDLFVGYSPERVDPGSPFELQNIPKVVSGITEGCQSRVAALYGKTFNRIIPVSNTRTAEMVKLLENCQRFINISFMNELGEICRAQNIDIWEVIEAASTKPFGFMPYFPGPGIGGHCIPIDPLYLKWKANQLGLDTRMIDAAHDVNSKRPGQVVKLLEAVLGKSTLSRRRILVLGVAYKKDINDVRESPALPIIETLIETGAAVAYHDPHVQSVELHSGRMLTSIPGDPEKLISHVKQADCILILTDHRAVDYQAIADAARLVVDTRNVIRNIRNSGNVIVL